MGLGKRSKRVDFADIVNQSEPRTRPLYIHFGFGSQSEAVHTLMHTNVGKDRLNTPETPGIDTLPELTIDPCLHLIDQIRLLGIDLNGEIPARSI